MSSYSRNKCPHVVWGATCTLWLAILNTGLACPSRLLVARQCELFGLFYCTNSQETLSASILALSCLVYTRSKCKYTTNIIDSCILTWLCISHTGVDRQLAALREVMPPSLERELVARDLLIAVSDRGEWLPSAVLNANVAQPESEPYGQTMRVRPLSHAHCTHSALPSTQPGPRALPPQRSMTFSFRV